jgi:hypothetical protein
MENMPSITMQGLAGAREKPVAKEQWVSMQKTMSINGKTMAKNNGQEQWKQ